MIVFRHADPRLPFLWEDPTSAGQPEGRWHAAGDGPTHYFADTPDGAWAELLRHEDIRDPADVATIRRSLWAVALVEDEGARPRLARAVTTGGIESYDSCRAEARRLRDAGLARLDAPSAALLPGAAHGHVVCGGLQPGPKRDGRTIVLFGARPRMVGWRAVYRGHPHPSLARQVNYPERGRTR